MPRVASEALNLVPSTLPMERTTKLIYLMGAQITFSPLMASGNVFPKNPLQRPPTTARPFLRPLTLLIPASIDRQNPLSILALPLKVRLRKRLTTCRTEWSMVPPPINRQLVNNVLNIGWATTRRVSTLTVRVVLMDGPRLCRNFPRHLPNVPPRMLDRTSPDTCLTNPRVTSLTLPV